VRKDSRVLDIGAGEGYVGWEISRQTSAEVVLCDVRKSNRTPLPFDVLDSGPLPYDSETFDVSILVFVLHHAARPESLLAEARRVARHDIVVVESVFTNCIEHRLLIFLDRLANRIRSKDEMRAQEDQLEHRTADGWREMFEQVGLGVEAEIHSGRFPHRIAAFRLRASERAGMSH
jgi:ubiquinone/menaquinone biosynthesis C-methylase UbiE